MLRDLFPDIPDPDSVPNCAEGGVLGVLCGTVGSAMATEAIKLICGIGTPFIGRLLRYDALDGEYSTLRFSPDPDRPAVTDLTEVAAACAASAPGAATGSDAGVEEIDPVGLAGLDPAPALIAGRVDWARALPPTPASLPRPLASIREHGWPAGVGMFDQASEQMPEDIVIPCQSALRSAAAVGLLSHAAPPGVRLRSLAGGITA